MRIRNLVTLITLLYGSFAAVAQQRTVVRLPDMGIYNEMNKTLEYGGRLRDLELNDYARPQKPYLDRILQKYESDGVDMADFAKQDSVRELIDKHVIEGLVIAVNKVSRLDTTSNIWTTAEFVQTFHSYYAFQQEVFGKPEEVAIVDFYRARPWIRKRVYPSYQVVVAEVTTSTGSGKGIFQYYQYSRDSFQLYKYTFYPAMNEPLFTTDYFTTTLFKALKEKNYALIRNELTTDYKNRISNEEKFVRFLRSINIDGANQFTSLIALNENGPFMKAYYTLADAKSYLVITFRKEDSRMKIDALNVLEKDKEGMR